MIKNQYTHKCQKLRITSQQKGFTLIELMVVLVIIAILASIAIPGYRQYAIKNAEDEAKAQMQQIQIQLERWRASTLSYKGFVPKNVDSSGNIIHKYDGSTPAEKAENKYIYVPLGSKTPRYIITLVDGSDTTKSLVQPSTSGSTTVTPSVARSWKMLALPNTDGSVGYDGQAFILTSTGQSCKKAFGHSITVAITATCDSSDEAW